MGRGTSQSKATVAAKKTSVKLPRSKKINNTSKTQTKQVKKSPAGPKGIYLFLLSALTNIKI